MKYWIEQINNEASNYELSIENSIIVNHIFLLWGLGLGLFKSVQNNVFPQMFYHWIWKINMKPAVNN